MGFYCKRPYLDVVQFFGLSNVSHITGRCAWLQLYNLGPMRMMGLKFYSASTFFVSKSASITVLWSCLGRILFDWVVQNLTYLIRGYLVGII